MKLLLDTPSGSGSSRTPRSSLACTPTPSRTRSSRSSCRSLWEVGIKQKQGKLAIGVSFEELLERGLPSVEVLDIRLPHVLRTNELPMHHRDPFDRILIAQALVEGLTLLTVDHVIPAYGVPILPS